MRKHHSTISRNILFLWGQKNGGSNSLIGAINASCNQRIMQSTHHAINVPCNQRTMQSTHHAINASCNQRTMQSTHHAINAPCNQRIMQSTHHAINDSDFHLAKHPALCVLPVSCFFVKNKKCAKDVSFSKDFGWSH
jgi:hypothetical protein